MLILWLLEHLVLLWILVRSRSPLRREVKAVIELIDLKPGDWDWNGDTCFYNQVIDTSIRDWWDIDEWILPQMTLRGSLGVDSLSWSERRALRAARRRWELKRIDAIVIKALEE